MILSLLFELSLELIQWSVAVRLQNIPELKTLHSCETTRSPQEVRPAEVSSFLLILSYQHFNLKLLPAY